MVIVHELTTLRLSFLKKSEPTSGVKIRMPFGRIWTKFKSVAKGKKPCIRVYTPAAVATVRGTSFFVESEKNSKKSRIGVWEGSVDVASQQARKKARSVKAGYEILVLYNTPLTNPSKMAKKELERRQRFEKQIESLGVASTFGAVRGMAEMNEMALKEAEDTVNNVRLRQKGDKIIAEDFKTLKKALARLYADTGFCPGKRANKVSGRKSLRCLIANKNRRGKEIEGWQGPYMDSDLKDPFGTPYSVYLKKL